MGLIDLQTDLTSLKYGDNKPIVRHEIGNKISQASARTSDVKRIAGILTRAPGKKFGFNQVLLQKAKIGDAASGKKTIGGTLLAVVGGAVKAAVGQGLFLTANAAKAGTGYHSINPAVAKSYIEPGKEMPQLPGLLGAIQKVTQVVNKVQQAIGAKSAAYHAGKEILGGSKTLGSVKLTDSSHFEREGGDGPDQGTTETTYIETKSVDKSGKVEKAVSTRELRRKAFKEDIEDKEKYLESGKSRNHEKFGEKISKGSMLTATSYYHGDGDQRQALDILTDSNDLKGIEKDIIPFTFNFYTPGEGDTDKFLYFRALLDSMSDSYTANWAGIKYVGRAEEFFNYTGFSRTFSFAFKAAAFSKKQLYPIYRKLNHLVGGTAPTYGKDGLFMRGTLLKLTIGDYLINQNGFLTSVNLTWNNDYPWEIEGDLRVPHLLDVACEFTPIHTFNPEFGIDEKDFIGTGNASDTTEGSSGDFSTFTDTSMDTSLGGGGSSGGFGSGGGFGFGG